MDVLLDLGDVVVCSLDYVVLFVCERVEDVVVGPLTSCVLIL